MSDIPEFGRRRPQRLPDMQPEPAAAQKRSRHVKLLVMGAFVVGGFGWAWMERQTCRSAQVAPGMAAPVTPEGSCTSGGHSGYSGSHSSRFGFFSGGSSGGVSTGGSDSASSSTSRGGFGSFGRAFGFGGG
jgi:hypothetical protein